MEITPGIWKASHLLDNITYLGNSDGTIAKIMWLAGIPSSEQKANAERMVKAVNSYDAMYDALLDIKLIWTLGNIRLPAVALDKIDTALDKAEGK